MLKSENLTFPNLKLFFLVQILESVQQLVVDTAAVYDCRHQLVKIC